MPSDGTPGPLSQGPKHKSGGRKINKPRPNGSTRIVPKGGK